MAVLHNYNKSNNKSGVFPIHIRVTIDRKPDYYRVKIPIKGVAPSDWQGKEDAWVKITHDYSFQINNAVRDLKRKITDINKRFFDQGKKLTHFHIKREIGLKDSRVIFNDYFKNFMKDPPTTVVLTPVTWEKYDAFIKYLDKFNPKIRFDEIDMAMVASIRNYLAKQRGKKSTLLAPPTVKSYFDKFAAVLRYAAEEDNLIDEKLVETILRKGYSKYLTAKESL